MTLQSLPLGEVLEFFNGKAPPEQRDAGEFPIYGSNGIIGYSEHANHENAIILGRVGAYCGSVEYCATRFWASDNTIVVKPRDGHDILYLYYRLKSSPLRGFAGGAAQPLLTHGILKGITPDIADEADQPAIASTLGNYDYLIANNRRRIELLEQSARLLFKEWFVHLRYPGHEHDKIVDGVPDGWTRTTVGGLVDVQSGFPFKSSTFGETGSYGVVTIGNVQDGYFDPACVSRLAAPPEKMPIHCVLSEGDILLSLTGNIGRVCLVVGDQYLLNQRVAKLAPRHGEQRAFIYFLFRDLGMRKRLEGLSGGVAQQNLSPITMATLDIVVPRPTLIREFSEFCEPVIAQIMKLTRITSRLEKARDLLLPRLMDGRLSV